MRYLIALLTILPLVLFLASGRLAPAQAAPATGPALGLQSWTLRFMSFEQVVEFARAHQIRYLELTSQHLDPDAPLEETLRKKSTLERYGLIPYTFGVTATSADEVANRKLFEFARLIGARLIVVEPAPEDWDSLEALVKEYDIKLAIHNHGSGTPYGDPKVVERVLAARDARIGVCLDTGWITQAGYDAAQVFRNYRGRVFDIHLKDKRVRSPGDPSPVDTELGKGSVNFAGLFAAIHETGWSGVMAIETDSDALARHPQAFVVGAKAFFDSRHEN